MGVLLSSCVLRIGWVLHYTGDSWPFFGPEIILPLLFSVLCLVFLIVPLILLICRRWRLAGVFLIPIVSVFVTGRIAGMVWSWDRFIAAHDVVNRAAILSVQDYPEYQPDPMLYSTLWDEAQELQPLPGFKWFGENHHHSAPEGVFKAFKVRGIVHVRLQKERERWLGLAFVLDPNLYTDLTHRLKHYLPAHPAP